MIASPRPRSTITLPYSTRLTVPFTISPMRLMYSSYIRSRSASRTFWTMTCLADWAAMRPNSIGGGGLALLRGGQRNLPGVLLYGLDHFEEALEAQLTRARVDLRANLRLCAIAGLGGLLDGVLHGLDHDHAVDGFFPRDRVCDLQQ